MSNSNCFSTDTPRLAAGQFIVTFLLKACVVKTFINIVLSTLLYNLSIGTIATL